MNKRALAGQQLAEIGFGCMNVNHAYSGFLTENEASLLFHQAIELGYNHFDTAALYGFGENERWLGNSMRSLRPRIFLASKCGMTGVNGKRTLDGRPETLVKTLEQALTRLQTDYIDLYYLHRIDPLVPIEESVGALSRMVEQGKIGAIGLSEVSSDSLLRAHQVHPIAAVQTEYSLWTRNAEISVLATTKQLGCAFIAFSPLGRGFLSAAITEPESLSATDIRRTMPRFQSEHWPENFALQQQFISLAQQAGCSAAQLAISWLLAQGSHIHVLPGSRFVTHLKENAQSSGLKLPAEVLTQAGNLISQLSVKGARYNIAAQADIDTEEFS